jgi:arylsulfatase A-like enzyme
MRRVTIVLAVICAFGSVRPSASAGDGGAASQPHAACQNVVFILVDDLGWRDLGCFGSTFYETPHVNRLAATGMKFAQAYAACPVCSPTRASILTGKYPQRLGLTDYIAANGSNQPEHCEKGELL